MRVQWDNILARASSLVATNADPDNPVSELYGNTHLELFKATANNTVITATFSSDEEVKCLVVGNQNIDTMTVVFKDSGGSTIDTKAYVGDDFSWTSLTGVKYVSGVQYFDLISGIREIEFTITGIGTVEIGGISPGVYLQFPNIATRPEYGGRHTGGVDKTDGGVAFDIPGYLLETFRAIIPVAEILDRDSINDFWGMMGSGKTMFLDTYPGIDQFRPWLANLISQPPTGVKHRGAEPLYIRNLELAFEECR